MRAWFRLDATLSRHLAFQPGETLAWRIEARSIEGNNELCLAFDTHRPDGTKKWWTGVLSTVEVPADGQWHWVTADVTVPEMDPDTSWLRPIFGLDATYDATPGRIASRSVELASSNEARVAMIANAAVAPPLDLSLYDRPDLQWLSTNFSCHFTFMYDFSFYDPKENRFMIEQFLEDARREFGGHDALLLWHAYPRIGIDERNQFDFYRDMPGGLELRLPRKKRRNIRAPIL